MVCQFFICISVSSELRKTNYSRTHSSIYIPSLFCLVYMHLRCSVAVSPVRTAPTVLDLIQARTDCIGTLARSTWKSLHGAFEQMIRNIQRLGEEVDRKAAVEHMHQSNKAIKSRLV